MAQPTLLCRMPISRNKQRSRGQRSPGAGDKSKRRIIPVDATQSTGVRPICITIHLKALLCGPLWIFPVSAFGPQRLCSEVAGVIGRLVSLEETAFGACRRSQGWPPPTVSQWWPVLWAGRRQLHGSPQWITASNWEIATTGRCIHFPTSKSQYRQPPPHLLDSLGTRALSKVKTNLF